MSIKIPLERSKTLTVLCVLILVGSGFELLSTLYSVIDYVQHKEERVEKRKAIEEFQQKMETLMESESESRLKLNGLDSSFNYSPYAIWIITSLSASLRFIAGLLLWRLKKVGFWLYLVAVFGSIIGEIGILGVPVSFAVFGITALIRYVILTFLLTQLSEMN
jgi:hypothetical protein